MQSGLDYVTTEPWGAAVLRFGMVGFRSFGIEFWDVCAEVYKSYA